MVVAISDQLLDRSARLLDAEPDEHLVGLAQMGHEAAFSAIVRRYEPELLTQARRLTSDGRGEDAVQQAFLNAFAALRAGGDVRHLRGWLHQILRNVVTRSRLPADVPLEVELADGESLEETVQRRAQAHAALVQLSALPDRQRDALMGTAVHGLPRAHVARTMGLSEGAVRQLVHRARRRMREAAAALLPFPLAKMFGAARSGVEAAPDAAIGAGAAASGGVAIKVGALVASGVVATGLAVTDTFPLHQHSSAVAGSHHHVARVPAAKHVAQVPASRVAVVPTVSEVHRVSALPHELGGGRLDDSRSGGVRGRDDGRGDGSGARGDEGRGRLGASDRGRDDGPVVAPIGGSDDGRGSGATSGGSGSTSGHAGPSSGSGFGSGSSSADNGTTSGQATTGSDGSGSSGPGPGGGGTSGGSDATGSLSSGSTSEPSSGSGSSTVTGDTTSGSDSGSSGGSTGSDGSTGSGDSGATQPPDGGSGSDGGQ